MVGSTDCIHKYGEPTPSMERKWLTLWDVPDAINRELPVIPNKIYCNRDLIAPLENAFWNIISNCLQDEVKTWDGCFNVRLVRGGKTWSLHSWAIAIDINAAWNGLGKEPQMSKELVKCFTDAGFDWGGTWTRKDGMHFQLKQI
ncbi:M15 family metallopeptidase [Leeuwenhoekiella sp. ZYFB001]|uniref:M15 family metallopeptidase n=1 Tax=Leeuwenhoekiella sp. ZYFB001 TaxID=2719912 RepID=UPI001431FCDF|nr:M15 family metallopeptidase [Leeuwenhoekiella sp. ZYFB001]